MTRNRDRAGLVTRLIPACLTIIDRHGPVTADVLGQILRKVYKIDLTTTELPMMICKHAGGQIAKTKVCMSFPPSGPRLVNVYHRPGFTFPPVPKPIKPVKVHPLRDGFETWVD